MNGTIKLVLGGIGAYFLYQWYQQNYGQVSTTSPQTGASGGASSGAITAQVTGNTPTEQIPTTILMMQQYAQQHNLQEPLTGWQWNWIYQQVRGVPVPTNANNPNNAMKYTLQEWWSYAHGHGLGAIFQIPAYAFSGGRGPRGHTQSSFRVRGQERASGWERARKVVLN